MWSPTHVQVLVKRAKGLNIKGKNGTNDAYVTIGLGREKYQTTVKEKSSDPVDWSEQCELAIPLQGNVADINLTVLHRNFLGVDEFLGQISLPLKDFDVYERPKSKWLPLKCKPGQNKNEYRGEIEVKVGFTVKATANLGGSVVDLCKKNKGSVSSLSKISGSISGSLMSLGRKDKKSKKKIIKSDSQAPEKASEKAKLSSGKISLQKQLSVLPENIHGSNEDPGVNSDDDDFDAEVEEEIGTLQSGDAAMQQEDAESCRTERSTQRLPPLNEDESSVYNLSEGKTLPNQIVVREKTREQRTVRVHKNSMEEWEQRLKGKQPGKLSAVDRIIEKNEQRNKKPSRESPQSPRRTGNYSPGAHSARLHKNSPYLTRLRRLEQSKHKRPKSLDLSDGRAETSNKFHYYSKQNILSTEDEFSDLDNEVGNITRDIEGCSSKKIFLESPLSTFHSPWFLLKSFGYGSEHVYFNELTTCSQYFLLLRFAWNKEKTVFKLFSNWFSVQSTVVQRGNLRYLQPEQERDEEEEENNSCPV